MSKPGTITVSISKSNFQKGLGYAKKFGGTYNPTDKTWTIPTHRHGIYNDALNAPGLYGLVVVNRNIPLDGEDDEPVSDILRQMRAETERD